MPLPGSRGGPALIDALAKPLAGRDLTREEATRLLETAETMAALLEVASVQRDRSWGRTVTYSRKAFLPVTNLCRDRCTYCTFRKDPDDPDAWTMTPEEIEAWSLRGRALGCKEALMCLGDKPELAFASYRDMLAELGHRTTVEYVHHACEIALRCGLLPHTNAGLLTREEMQRLKAVNVSLGLMPDPEVSVQAPPNLSPADHALLLHAGLNDWGGISPLTPDYVNPEAPWPHVEALAATCRAAGFTLRERLAIYPAYIDRPGFLDPALHPRVAALAAEAAWACPDAEARP